MANQRLWLAKALRAKRGADTVHRRKVGKSYNKICSETRGGFRASFGRGDPCTRYQAQSCAQRTTLLSVASNRKSGSASGGKCALVDLDSSWLFFVSFRAESAERRIPAPINVRVQLQRPARF